MKTIILPILKFLFAISYTIINIIAFLIINSIYFIWNFKFLKWSELLQNGGWEYDGKNYKYGLTLYKEDKNPLESFKRYYKLEFYD